MTDPTPAPEAARLPEDDPRRTATIAHPEAPDALHIALAGNTYTVLVGGEQTDGRYCLIDMSVPDGGGPPPHRHDFEEMFTVLAGEVEFTVRDAAHTVTAGTTINIPANAPHFFRNTSGAPARLLCMCTPAGQEEYFQQVGDPVSDRNAVPPALTAREADQRRRRAADLAARYRTEILV